MLTLVMDKLQVHNKNASLQCTSDSCAEESSDCNIIFQDDENDVLAELDQLIGADLEPTIVPALPSVPDTQPETIEDKLPDVPTKVEKCPAKQNGDNVL